MGDVTTQPTQLILLAGSDNYTHIYYTKVV